MMITTRERTTSTMQNTTLKRWTLPAWSFDGEFPALEQGLRSTCKDNNNAPFKKGRLAFSDVEIVSNKRSFTPGSAGNYQFWVYGDLTQYRGALGTSIESNLGRLETSDFLLTKAYAKMKESNLLIGEMAHDLSQTVSMLRRPFASAVDLLVRMDKSRLRRIGKSAASATRAASNAWLEYRYGWQPLLLDGRTIVKAVQTKIERNTRRLVARAGCQSSENSSWNWPATVTGDPVWTTRGSYVVVRKTKRDVGILYEVKLTSTSEEMQKFTGSRLCDFPATLWEIMPYSFVIDWFVNVGDWIQAITPVPGILPLGNWYTELISTTIDSSAEAVPTPGNPATCYGSLGSSHEEWSTYVRDCSLSLPNHPVMRYNGMSWQHQIDALALSLGNILTGAGRMRH